MTDRFLKLDWQKILSSDDIDANAIEVEYITLLAKFEKLDASQF